MTFSALPLGLAARPLGGWKRWGQVGSALEETRGAVAACFFCPLQATPGFSLGSSRAQPRDSESQSVHLGRPEGTTQSSRSCPVRWNLAPARELERPRWSVRHSLRPIAEREETDSSPMRFPRSS